MCFLRIQAHSYSRNFEVSPDEVENAELMVEDAVSLVLIDLFGEAEVDKVAVLFSSASQMGQRDCSIQIQAQCSFQSFTLFPRTKENIELAVGKIMCMILKELFGPVTMDSVSIAPSYMESFI
jgi:hypothetical protein